MSLRLEETAAFLFPKNRQSNKVFKEKLFKTDTLKVSLVSLVLGFLFYTLNCSILGFYIGFCSILLDLVLGYS